MLWRLSLSLPFGPWRVRLRLSESFSPIQLVKPAALPSPPKTIVGFDKLSQRWAATEPYPEPVEEHASALSAGSSSKAIAQTSPDKSLKRLSASVPRVVNVWPPLPQSSRRWGV